MMVSGFVARLAVRRDATAVAMRNALVEHVPGYATLSSAQQHILLGEVHETWAPVLKQAGNDEPLEEADLEPYRALARKRAADYFPLREVRAGFEVAHTTGLRECLSIMETGDGDGPIAFTAWGVRELPKVMGAVDSSYVAACGAAGNRTAHLRDLLVERLVEGRDAGEMASALGVGLPTGYLVLLCRPRFNAASPGTEAAFPRRTLQCQLAATPGILWRTGTVAGSLLILLPVHPELSLARAVAKDVTASLVGALGLRLDVAEAYGATLDAVPTAVREAEQSLALISAMPDAESRPYGTEELLVELAVSRQPELQQRLAGLLAPLQRGPDLQRTLEVLFDCGLDRQRTTVVLHIHRRSLTYRIQRIRELTGLDPTTAHGIQLLRSALTAARLRTIA